MNTELFIGAARSYLDTRFRYNGRDRRGIDCGGLVAACLGEAGLKIDLASFDRAVTPAAVRAELLKVAERVPLSDARPGDILLLSYHAPTHLAVCMGETVIHAFAPAHKVIEQSLPEVKPFLRAAYRVKERA